MCSVLDTIRLHSLHTVRTCQTILVRVCKQAVTSCGHYCTDVYCGSRVVCKQLSQIWRITYSVLMNGWMNEWYSPPWRTCHRSLRTSRFELTAIEIFESVALQEGCSATLHMHPPRGCIRWMCLQIRCASLSGCCRYLRCAMFPSTRCSTKGRNLPLKVITTRGSPSSPSAQSTVQ